MSTTEADLMELNAYVAEHVMGLKRTEQPDSHTDAGDPLFWDSGKAVVISRPYFSALHKKYAHSWSKFSPTTDPAAAMEVLERCLIKAAASYLHLLKYDDGFSICGPRGSIEAKTLPLVICLYAKEMFQ